MDSKTLKISMKMCKAALIASLCWGICPGIIGRAYQENLPYWFIVLSSSFIFNIVDYFMSKIFDNIKIRKWIFKHYVFLAIAIVTGDLISLLMFIKFQNFFQLLIIDVIVDVFNNAEGYMYNEIHAAWFRGNDKTEHDRRRNRYQSVGNIVAKSISLAVAFIVIGNSPITIKMIIIIESIMCVLNIICEIIYYRIYKLSIDTVESMWRELDLKNSSKESKSREFLLQVKNLSEKYGVPFFCVTDGASMTCNTDCDAIINARLAHIEWEQRHGFDPNEDWSNQ